ncbi:TRAP transporter large permease [Lacrimispora sp. 210928-DFI.3.58]|uniref:TRAP transporter large permease n=1 Tax=Lacrimispora sp. 210928-DFI.3.58 TaxID=2883214 RepID=UPI0015B6AF2F|nr:TRAP transporter large permease [Lacrimispora sp. 210928-DFI.3.58]MCB7317472.1 TRAP transporter large permease [Lacrimispora sp. 210928-DFI.3.58]
MNFLFLIVLILLMLCGVPVAYSIGIATLIGMAAHSGIQWGTLASSSLSGINSFTFLAIPLFLLAGKLMNTGGITRRLFRFAKDLVGWLPGGLGHVNVICSVIFAGMSGSAVADAGGLGAIELKAMRDDGFDDEFTCGVTACSSMLGPMIPPSIPMIVYGTISGASIGALFLAGVVPGILMALIMMGVVFIYAVIKKYPKEKFPSLSEAAISFKEAVLSLMTVVIILLGIYTGIFTATEAAAIVVIYAMILSVFIYKEVSLSDLGAMVIETVHDSATIGLVVAFSAMFGSILVRSMIPQKIAAAISGAVDSRVALILLINVFLLVVGMFMDATAAITILVPILLPLVKEWGISPVQFGIIFVLNMGIGSMTPPFGILIFVMSKLSGLPAMRLVKAYIPWMGAMIAALLLVSFVPQLSLTLPVLANYSVF